MKTIINKKIATLIQESIYTLKNNLAGKELPIVKNALLDVYKHKAITSDSYSDLIKNNKIEPTNQFKVEEAFHNIGDLIAVPARTGSTNLLNEAYKEDVTNPTELPFPEYQGNVIDYVMGQVNDNF